LLLLLLLLCFAAAAVAAAGGTVALLGLVAVAAAEFIDLDNTFLGRIIMCGCCSSYSCYCC